MTNVVRFRLSCCLTLEEQVEDLMLVWKAFGTLATQRKVAFLMGAMVAMLLHIAWHGIHRGGQSALLVGAIAGLILYATVGRRLRRTGRTVLKKINGHDAPIDMVVELTDSEVIVRRLEDEQIWKWSAIRSVTQDADAIRLLTARYTMVNLPEKAFRSQKERDECLAFVEQRVSLNARHT
jgi:hypothetical protein